MPRRAGWREWTAGLTSPRHCPPGCEDGAPPGSAVDGKKDSCGCRVRDVIDTVLAAYPASLAEDWDTGIGLTCGDPDDVIGSVLLAVDADEATVGEAIRTRRRICC